MNENRHICRGKREDNGEWVYGYYVRLPDATGSVHRMYVPAENPDESNAVYYIDPKTLGECTGCLDVQGRLIYEGDIVKNTEVGIVRYVAEEAAFLILSTENDNAHYMYITDKAYEIIGNVHDNPRLLEDGDSE